jgi:signal transduction histidine kinase/HAMP domain-containing protein
MRTITRRGVVADLVVLIAATLLPLLLLGGYLAYRNIAETRADASERALWQARETAARVDAIIGETQALLLGLAQTPTLRAGDPDEVRVLLREVKVRYPYLDDLLAIDAEGTIYVSAASFYDEAIGNADPRHVREVLDGKQLATSELLFSQATGRPVVLVGVPVYAGPGGRSVIGEVAAALDLLLLQQWLDDRTLGPGTTITVIDNQEGRVLARSADPEAWVGRSVGDIPLVQTAIASDEGVLEGTSLDQAIHLSAFTTAERVPWTVIVGIPDETVNAPLRQELRLMLLRLAFTGLAVVTLAAVGSRRIVGPLRRLTGGALAIARGDLDHRLAVERRDEVGRVAGAVNQMADELVGTIAALQQAQERLEGAVAQVGRALTSTAEAPDLFARLVEAACALTRSDAGALIVRGGFAPIVWGDPPPAAPLLRALTTGETAAPPDRPSTLLPPLDPHALQGTDAHEHLVVAVRAHDRALGALHVFRRRPSPYGVGDARLLRAFADQAAVAIEQDRLRKEVAEAAALRRLHQLQSQFLTTAAHELRAPVAGIKSYAELLLREDLPLDLATRQECLAGIDRLSDRLAAQVRAFFDAMRAEAGQLALVLEAVDLAEVAGAVVRDFAARSPDHTFTLDAAGDLPPALADRARVEDVLTNLLDNAVKYSPEGGPIAVAIATVPGERGQGEPFVRVAVSDAGIGIPVAERGQVFERFYRLDETTTRQRGGIGLGLYLCRAYVEGMGGTIGVESSPGEGSTFAFTLPLAAPVLARSLAETNA